MAAATARLLLEQSVQNVEKLQQSRRRGFYSVDKPERLYGFLSELQSSSSEFMDAVLQVIESGLDDLYQVNSAETMRKHLDAFNVCEQVSQQKQGRFDLEHAMALSAVGADYTELIERRPLQRITRDQDAPFSIFLEPLTMPMPVLVSGVERSRLKRQTPQESQTVTKRVRVTPSRRSARIAALQAPSSEPPDTHPPLVRGTRITDAEVEQQATLAAAKSMKRAKAKRRPKKLESLAGESREATTSLQTAQESSWMTWITTELQDPSTTILDLVAAVSSSMAREFSVPFAALGSFTFQRFLSSFLNKTKSEQERQELSTTMTAMRSISSASLVQNFSRLTTGSLHQLAAVTTGSIVEIIYNFVTLSSSSLTQPLSEKERSTWFRFLYKWSPLIALALALALITVRQDVVLSLITPNVVRISGGSIQSAASTPGALVTSIASSYLPADSVAVQLLEQFYDFASEGITQLQKPPLGAPLRKSVVEFVGMFVGHPSSSTTINWIWGYYDFLSRLHRLQFAAPMLHAFSLVEHGANMLARSWRWVARRLKNWVGEDNPIRDIIDWGTELADFVVLLIRFPAQLFRYHSLMLLLLALLQALLHYGVEGTSSALQRPLTFGGLM